MFSFFFKKRISKPSLLLTHTTSSKTTREANSIDVIPPLRRALVFFDDFPGYLLKTCA